MGRIGQISADPSHRSHKSYSFALRTAVRLHRETDSCLPAAGWPDDRRRESLKPKAGRTQPADAASWPRWFRGDGRAARTCSRLFSLSSRFVRGPQFRHLGPPRRRPLAAWTAVTRFGNDPFSYSAADRVWVNHAWLYDALRSSCFGRATGRRSCREGPRRGPRGVGPARRSAGPGSPGGPGPSA